MSASDELPAGDDPSSNSVLTGTIGFLDAGGQLGTLLQGAIFGTLVSFATGGINLIQSMFGLIISPIDGLAESVDQFIASAILAPLGIIESTADTSAAATSEQFGVFAVLVGVSLVLGAWWIITKYLEQSETSDTIPLPGFPDTPDIGPLEVGVEEEDEVDD